jgi:hypothetical protein
MSEIKVSQERLDNLRHKRMPELIKAMQNVFAIAKEMQIDILTLPDIGIEDKGFEE